MSTFRGCGTPAAHSLPPSTPLRSVASHPLPCQWPSSDLDYRLIYLLSLSHHSLSHPQARRWRCCYGRAACAPRPIPWRVRSARFTVESREEASQARTRMSHNGLAACAPRPIPWRVRSARFTVESREEASQARTRVSHTVSATATYCQVEVATPPHSCSSLALRGGGPRASDETRYILGPIGPALPLSSEVSTSLAAICANHASRARADEYLGLPCVVCGRVARSWCNTCELYGMCPFPNFPNQPTPLCHTCENSNQPCRVCGTRPSAGPSELDMLHTQHTDPAADRYAALGVALKRVWRAQQGRRDMRRAIRVCREVAVRKAAYILIAGADVASSLSGRALDTTRTPASTTASTPASTPVEDDSEHSAIEAAEAQVRRVELEEEARAFHVGRTGLGAWRAWDRQIAHVLFELCFCRIAWFPSIPPHSPQLCLDGQSYVAAQRSARRRCVVCHLSPARQTCGVCRGPSYCSHACMRAHWHAAHRHDHAWFYALV
jgi:hypothetical protein